MPKSFKSPVLICLRDHTYMTSIQRGGRGFSKNVDANVIKIEKLGKYADKGGVGYAN